MKIAQLRGNSRQRELYHMRTLTTVLVVSLPSVISAFQGTGHLSTSRSLFDTNAATAAAVCYHGRRDNGVRCVSGGSSHPRVFRPRHHRLGAAQQPSGDNSIGAGLEEITVEIKGGIKSIHKEDWDSLLRPEDSPFLEHDWIYSMEESKCATIDTGWQPQHLAVKRSKGSPGLMAAVPLYVKYHSQGEFIFDQSWAEASYRAGMPYYPKLLVGVPFTPAEGARVLIDPSLTPETMRNIRRAVGVFLRKLAQDNNISSVHVNFCTEDEVEAFTSVGFLHRKGLQYHWRNKDRSSSSSSDVKGGAEASARGAEGEAAGATKKYRDFDSYLGNFASKRRIKIRRERRSVYDDAGVNVTAYRGEEITDSMLEKAFLIYKSTIDKMIYGRLYLNSDFFKELARRFKRNIVLILAEKNGKVIAGTFNVVKAGRFYGRYWGAFETVKNLHFETCYYKAIEFCIENGLDVMEPGAGGGDFKFLRGFDPAIINSCHFCIHPGLGGAVDNFLMEERRSIDEAEEYLMAKSALANRTSSSGGGGGGRSSEDTATVVLTRAEERSS